MRLIHAVLGVSRSTLSARAWARLVATIELGHARYQLDLVRALRRAGRIAQARQVEASARFAAAVIVAPLARASRGPDGALRNYKPLRQRLARWSIEDRALPYRVRHLQGSQ